MWGCDVAGAVARGDGLRGGCWRGGRGRWMGLGAGGVAADDWRGIVGVGLMAYVGVSGEGAGSKSSSSRG